jgi:enediyne polyketide synthase
MGQRLGRVEALARAGVTPITPDEGVQWFLRSVADSDDTGAVGVTSRFGDPPTVSMEAPDLPHLRFLLGPRVYMPGVELVSEVDLSIGTDPYLEDHRIQGTPVFPAVMGLEAMAQVAAGLVGSKETPYFEDVEFLRPITVPSDGKRSVRIAGLVGENQKVQVVIRSDETSFQADHFRAVCCFDSRPEPRAPIEWEAPGADEDIGVDPKKDLYGGLLFHGERFQLLSGYQRLTAWECEAVVSGGNADSWFSAYHPGDCLLGDPGRRDAGIHAIQACVPHATVLPVGVDRVIPYGASQETSCHVRAKERFRDGDLFVYDMEFQGPNHQTLEVWEGLKLRIAQPVSANGRWVRPLLATYLERRLEELVPEGHIRIALTFGSSGSRRSRTDEAIRRSLGSDVEVLRRPDGKPEVASEMSISASHAENLTIAVAGRGAVTCDVEPITSRAPQVWQELLGEEGFRLAEVIAKEAGESLDKASTRVWTSLECLKKIGKFIKSPLRFERFLPDGWVLLGAGRAVVATCRSDVRDVENPLVLSFLWDQKRS